MRLVHYSVCRVCGEAVPYAGKGRPKAYCPKCKEQRRKITKEDRRLYMAKYMNGYRKKLYKMILSS